MMQVFGVPDQRMGEEIAAWLRMAPGKEMLEQDVKSFLKGKVSLLTSFDQNATFLPLLGKRFCKLLTESSTVVL